MSTATPSAVVKAETVTTLYRAFDACGQLLYVGITESAFERLAQHSRAGWAAHTVSMTFEKHDTRTEAAQAELSAIRTEDPVWNIAGRSSERHLRWMAAYPDLDPDEVDLDSLLTEADRFAALLRGSA